MTSQATQNQYAKLSLPIWASSYDDPAVTKGQEELISAAKVGLAAMYPRPTTPKYQELSTALQQAIQESLLGLRAAQVPVFTVGLGSEALQKDIQVSRVSTPRKVLKGTNLSVDVIVLQNGFKGRTVALNVEDSGRILSTQEVALTNDGEPTTVKVHFTATEAGARTIRFRIPMQECHGSPKVSPGITRTCFFCALGCSRLKNICSARTRTCATISCRRQ